MVCLEERYGTTDERNGNKIPPSNVIAEEDILGECLIRPDAYHQIKDIITDPNMFYDLKHRKIWKAIVAVGKSGKEVSLMSVTLYLQERDSESHLGINLLADIGGTDYLGSLLQRTWSIERTVRGADINTLALFLVKKYRQRKLVNFGHECLSWGYENSLEEEHVSQVFDRVKSRLEEIVNYPVGETPLERRRKQYDQKIQRIENYLLNIDDLGFREELLGDLANEYGTTASKLKTLYYKSLIGANNGKSLTFKELREQYGNDITEWVIHGLLPRGSATMLYAHGGIGKSLVMYDLVFHMLFGMDWNEFPIVKRHKGLIIQTDEAESDLINHLSARGFTEDLDFKVKTDWSIEYLPQLYKEIQQEKYDWVTIDSLTSVSRHSCVDENGTEYAMPVLQLNNIASKTNTHILLLHHSNKSDGSARGSSAIQAAVSQVIKLDRDPNASDDCLRVLTFTKSRSRRPGAYEIRLHADEEPGKRRNYWELVREVRGIHGADPNSDWKTRIKLFLKQNLDRFFYGREICEAIQGKWNTIRKCLAALGGTGEIGREERPGKANLYFLGSPGRLEENQGSEPAPPEVDLPADAPDGGRGEDREEDRVSSPEPEPVSAKPDLDIAQNEEILLEESTEISRSEIGGEVNPSEGNGSEGDLAPDLAAIATPEDRVEENIVAIVEDLRVCGTVEAYDAIFDTSMALQKVLRGDGILPPDLLEEAIARLSPEEQARIDNLLHPPKSWPAPVDLKKGERVVAPENSDWGVGIVQKVYAVPDCGVQVHVKWKAIKEDFPVSIFELAREGEWVAPAKSEEDEREEAIAALVEQLEDCPSITHFDKLIKGIDSDLLAAAIDRCAPIPKLKIGKWLRQEEERKQQLERELNHVNPFSSGDRVALLGSPLLGLGEVCHIHRNQCRVIFGQYESPYYDHTLLKAGQKVYYVGDDEKLKNTFANPKAGKKYRSLYLTVKTLKEEAGRVRVELTHEKWLAWSFWVDLGEVKK